MKKWTAKMKSMQKLGKEHLDCKKSTMAKSQWSNLVKVNRQKKSQRMMLASQQAMTSADEVALT